MTAGDAHDAQVHAILAAHAEVTIPDQVQSKIMEALAREQAARSAGECKVDYDSEVAQRSALGSFGQNGPAHYDKSGLGLELHDTHHHPHLGRA